MALSIKKAGAYSAAAGVFVKKTGVYSAVQAMFVKQSGVYQNVLSASNLPALSGITTVWLFGASIEAGISGSGLAAQIMQDYMLEKHGLSLTFAFNAFSGHVVSVLLGDWNGVKSGITGRSDVLVATMPLGNDISLSRPYSGMTAPNQVTLYNNYAALINAIPANGNIVMPINTTFRDYGGVGVTVNNEAHGSLPFNEAIVYPVNDGLTPAMNVSGVPFADPYNLTRNWYSRILADDVHPTEQGYHLFRSFWIDNIAARIKGEAPVRIARVEDPTLSQATTAKPCLIMFQVGGLAGKSMSVYGAWIRGDTSFATIAIGPLDGYVPSSVTTTGIGGSMNTNSAAMNTGNKSNGLLNDAVKSNYLYTASLTSVDIQSFAGYAPNQPVAVNFITCRAIVATDRVGQYSIDGFATFVEASGTAPLAGQEPVIHSITGNANASGVFTFSMRCKAGSTFCYVNGIHVVPG